MQETPERPPALLRRVLDHGYVALVDVMGDDLRPAKTARTSFAGNRKKREREKDLKLTRFLMREGHTTPIEFNQLLFYMHLPLFVAAQIVRHRTASINQISYRYVEAKEQFYVPAVDRMNKASKDKKQGSSDVAIEDPTRYRGLMLESQKASFEAYQDLLAVGLAPELARVVLPQGTYTEWYWQMDLHNLQHFLSKRLAPDAQYETRQYALAVLQLTYKAFPDITANWADLHGYGEILAEQILQPIEEVEGL